MELDLIAYRDVEATEDIVKVTTFATLTGLPIESWAQSYWTRTISEMGYVYAITPYPLLGGLNSCSDIKTNDNRVGIRPVLKLTKDEFRQFSGKELVTFGEYPQGMLHELLIDNLEPTGKKYTYLHHSKEKQELRTLLEYSYNGKKYALMISNKVYHNATEKEMPLVDNGDLIWFKVEPVEWLVIESKQMLVATKILLGGVPFDNSYYADSYDKSYIKMFLEKYMAKEMFSTSTKNSLLESDDALKDYFLGEKRKQLIKGKW